MVRMHILRPGFFLALASGLMLVGPAAPQQEGPRPANPQQEGPRPAEPGKEGVRPGPPRPEGPGPKAVLKNVPRLEPVADTLILMEGINRPNYLSMERRLRERPADEDAWAQIRGEALLIAENGNLLMLRPPRKQGQEAWMDRAVSLRTTATRLARAAGDSNYENCRLLLKELGTVCNRCHQTFRVDVKVMPFREKVISSDGGLPPVPEVPAPPLLPGIPRVPAVPPVPDPPIP